MDKPWMVGGKFTNLDESQRKELNDEQLAAYTAAVNKAFVDSAIVKVHDEMDEKMKNTLSKEDLDKVKADFEEGLKGLDTKALASYVETIEALKKDSKDALELAKEVKEIARKQGLDIKANEGGFKVPDIRRKSSREDHIKALITNSFCSDEFKQFQGRGFKGSSIKMYLDQEGGKVNLKDLTNRDDAEASKATIATSSHTGVAMISEVSDIVRDDAPTRTSHVRDILNVSMTDQAQVVAGQVYDFTDALTLGAIMLSENGEAPESMFKSKENTWTIKRIANSMRISKREIKVNGLKWVIDKVMAKLPDSTLFVEDVQLMFGDGIGNNAEGLTKAAQPFNLAPNVYAATAIASVTTYDSGAQSLITFASASGLKNGDNLTIANATVARYNATHKSAEVINSKQVVIDVAYVAEADTSAWTGSSTSPFYQSIEAAQEYDVLAVADANLEAREFMNKGYIIHPSQSTQMGLLKATDANYLNIAKDANGKITGVNGKPVVTTTAMPYGKFLCGDFSTNGVELKEFTPLNIQFIEDVVSVKKNEIVVVIEEEIIFPIYNPYWFTYGKFSTAKTQLETPA